MLISGETARYELTHLNPYCLQKTSILPLGAEKSQRLPTYRKSAADEFAHEKTTRIKVTPQAKSNNTGFRL